MRKMLAASDSSGWLVVRRVSAGGWFLGAALVFLALACPAFSAEQDRAKNVLVIDSFSDRTWDSVAILKPPPSSHFVPGQFLLGIRGDLCVQQRGL
jgi:hypothetical protein